MPKKADANAHLYTPGNVIQKMVVKHTFVISNVHSSVHI